MQNKQTLVETAYKFLCKKKKSNFTEIWTHVKKQCNIVKDDEEKSAGDLYTGMILDTNFFLKNDKLWYPSCEVSLEEKKEQMTKIELPNDKIKDSSETIIDTTDDVDFTKLDDEELDEDDEELEETISIKPIEDDYDE